MGRTSAGVSMLALAVAVFAGLTVLGQAPRQGAAQRAEPPMPPPVGSCGSMSSGELLLVDCALLHTVEVAGGWRATEASPAPTFGSCSDEARSYVGVPPANEPAAHPHGRWSLPMRYRPTVRTGPGAVALAGWSWQVCLVVASGPAPWAGYRGTVRDLPSPRSTPAAMRLCYVDAGRPLGVVGCGKNHAGEIVAVQPTDATAAADPAARAAWERTCTDEAARFTGSTDPTFGGALSAKVLPESGRRFPGPLSADVGVYYTIDGGLVWLVCALEVAGSRNLTASVGGLGDGELPLN